MLKLLLIRHGESTSNRDRRMTGRDDYALTAKGRQQCRQLATWLYRQNWRPNDIYCSPLRRALESAEVLIEPWQWQFSQDAVVASERSQAGGLEMTIAASTKLLPHGHDPAPGFSVCDRLQEFNAGILTGLTWAEAQRQYPDLCQRLETTADWVPIPQAETPLQGRQRAAEFIRQLLAEHHNGDTIWVIAHHWILEHLIAGVLGCDRTWQVAMPNTAIFEFWLDRDRWTQTGMSKGISDLWQIKQFNGVQHLTTTDDD